MDIFTSPWQTPTMIRRTYLQVFWVCIIWAFFINNFLQWGADVLAKTYDTVRIKQLDTVYTAMIMDWSFSSEQEIVCGAELNKRLHSILPSYTSDPTGLNIPWCDDWFAFVPFVTGGGGVLVTVVEDKEQANYNHDDILKQTTKKTAVSNICHNWGCDDIWFDDAEHVGYHARIISL